jgi:hypothetical protein
VFLKRCPRLIIQKLLRVAQQKKDVTGHQSLSLIGQTEKRSTTMHKRVKILSWPTKKYGTFSGSNFLADSKNVHSLYAVKFDRLVKKRLKIHGI